MDNSVQGIQFLDLSELTEGEQAAINGFLHGDPQQGKLSWGTQRYPAPAENNVVEPTVEHYVEPHEERKCFPGCLGPGKDGNFFLQRVNGDDEHSLPAESIAVTADDAKPLPPVQELSPNDVTLIPAHEQHPDPVSGPPVAAAGHVPSHQDFLPGGLPAQAPMYVPGVYGMSQNVGYMYNYQGQQGPVIRDPSRGRNRKSSAKQPCEIYNQEAPMMVSPMMAMEYPANQPYYHQVTPPFFYEQHQGPVCYPPYVVYNPPPSYPPMQPYPEQTTPKGPPEPKKSYPMHYYPMQPKHDLSPKMPHSKNDEPKEFKPASMDNRNKPLDKSKPPQSALKLSARPDINKKPVTGGIKVESAEGSNDDITQSARGPPPGRYSAPRQPPQEPVPAPVPHAKVSPVPTTGVPVAIPPQAGAPVTPVASVAIPVTVPVPVPMIHPVPHVPVLSGPPAVVAGPLLCPGVPAESLPGPVPAVLTAPVVAAPSQPLPIPAPAVSLAPDVPVAPVATMPEAERLPPAPVMTAAQPLPAQSAKVPGVSEVQCAAPPAAAAAGSSYASALRSPSQPAAPKAAASAAPPGDKPTARVKPFSNEEQESKSQGSPFPKVQDKPPSQIAKPPAGAMKVARRQDLGRKSMSAVVKSESSEAALAPAAVSNQTAPFSSPPHAAGPGVATPEAASDGSANRPLRPQGPNRFQGGDPLSQKGAVTSPIPGVVPAQQVPLSHGAKTSPTAVSATAAWASDGAVAQTPVAAAKQPVVVKQTASAPVEPPPAAPAAVRSYAFALSKSATSHSPAEANSVLDRSQEADSPSWEPKRNSAPVTKPMTAPPLPSLSKDPELFHLGEYLTKCKLSYSPSNLQPRGLSNRSNWCYIHATLQALLACPPFYNLMKSLPHSPKDCSPSESCTPIIDSIVRFINEFPKVKRSERNARAREENANSATPEVPVGAAFEPTYVYRMLSAIRSDTFKVEGRQEDAEEFLSCLLNGLHDEMLELTKMVAAKNSENNLANGDVATNGDLSQDEGDWSEMGPKKKKTVVRRHDFGRTPLSDIFRGVLRSCVIRDQAPSHSHNVQPFFTLQLDVENSKSVTDALERYGTKDPLEGMTCAKTKKEVTAWQQVELEELPPVLLLHLKCFDYKMDGASKICRVVEYPIDLKVQTKSCGVKGGRTSIQKMYKLFAVVYHDGKEATKGHYIADAYHVGFNQWLRYDDSSVTVVRQEQVLHARQPRVPYLLFYRRQDTCNS